MYILTVSLFFLSVLGFPLENSSFPTDTAQPENVTQWHQTLELPQVTYPSRLVGQTSGSETPRYQLDTWVRNETSPILVSVYQPSTMLNAIT